MLLSHCPWGSSWACFTQQMFSALCTGVSLPSTTAARPEADGNSWVSVPPGSCWHLRLRGGDLRTGEGALAVWHLWCSLEGEGKPCWLCGRGTFLLSVLLAGAAWSEGEQSAPLFLGCASWSPPEVLRSLPASHPCPQPDLAAVTRFLPQRTQCRHRAGVVPGGPGAGRAPRSAAAALALPQPWRPRGPRRKESTTAHPPARPRSSCRVLLEPPRAGSTSG